MVFFVLTEDMDSGNLAFNKRNFWQGLQDFNTGAGVGTLGSSGAGNRANVDSRGGFVGSRFDCHRHVGVLTGDAFEVLRGRDRQFGVSQVIQC